MATESSRKIEGDNPSLRRSRKLPTMGILLHIVTDWKGSAADGSQHKEETLQDYELSTAIYAALHDLGGEHFRITSLVRTLTNHNHQELLENIEVYNVTYARE